MKEHDKIMTGDLSKSEIKSTSDRESKVMVIRIVTGCWRTSVTSLKKR